jgi:hypothetical protein
LTVPGLFSARDTVIRETRARSATWRMVIAPDLVFDAGKRASPSGVPLPSTVAVDRRSPLN